MRYLAVLLLVVVPACTVERHDLAQQRVSSDTTATGDTVLDLRLGTVCHAYDRAAALARVDTLTGTERVDYLRAEEICQGLGYGPVDIPAPQR